MLRSSRDDQRREVRRPEGRHLVLRGHPLRYALRLLALRGPRHPSSLQKDPIRLFHFPQIALLKRKRPDLPHLKRKPTRQILNRRDKKPPLDVPVVTQAQLPRNNNRLQQNPHRAGRAVLPPAAKHRPRLRIKVPGGQPAQQRNNSLLPLPKKAHSRRRSNYLRPI